MEGSVLFFIIGILILVFFIWGLQQAFISIRRLGLELNLKQKTYAGKTWSSFAKKPAAFISTLFIAFGVLTVAYGFLIGEFLQPLWQNFERMLNEQYAPYLIYIRLFFEIILATALLLFVVFFSRSIFRRKAKSVMRSGFYAWTGSFFYSLFRWVEQMFTGISLWILRYVFDMKISKPEKIHELLDTDLFQQQVNLGKEDEKSELNKQLFENALTLKDVKLRDCLIPRKEIVGVEKNTPLQQVKQKFIETGLSKLVVYDINIDNIIGYIHQLEMFKNPPGIEDILLKIPAVPESMNATDLLKLFSSERKSIAWVIDEFGGTAGIITMEDVQEEIFGDIKDEYDVVDEFVDKQLSQNEFLFSGRLELDHIEDKYRLEFPEKEEAQTVSGYIIQHNEGIPREKQTIIIGNFEFTVMNLSETRIEMVKMKVLG